MGNRKGLILFSLWGLYLHVILLIINALLFEDREYFLQLSINNLWGALVWTKPIIVRLERNMNHGEEPLTWFLLYQNI